MAPRQHAPPRRVRRGGYRYRRRRVRAPIGAGERRELVRNRLIESRLSPNTISLTGLALNVLAAVLVWEQLMFLGGVAFIIGSIMDTLDGRYSRMSGKGTPFGAFLDSTLDRIEEGVVLTAVAGCTAIASPRPRWSSRCWPRSWSATHARARRRSAWSARWASQPGPCAW
jgi:hypothetical protein